MPNSEESAAVEPIRDVGDTGSRGHVGSSMDAVGGYVHWPQEGGSGPVGGDAPYILSLLNGEELQG